MACYVPFSNRNLDISFFAFRPMVVLVDELLVALKHFSLSAETLGCVHSAIFHSIHGNMIIWYGAWMKRSDEKKEMLNATLLSMLANVSAMAILIDHSFFEAYAGESRDGSPAAKFITGDVISINVASLSTDDLNSLSHTCLAIFKTRFIKMDGAMAGVCLKNRSKLRIVSLFVWKSLHSCYTWILNADHRKSMVPHLEGLPIEIKYDIFRVVYVSSDDIGHVVMDFGLNPLSGREDQLAEL